MIGRARSYDALESSDENWIISSPSSHQLYDIPTNNKRTRIPPGNNVRAKPQGHHTERWAGSSTALSKEAHAEALLNRDGKRGRSDYVTRRLKSNNHRNHSVETPSTHSTKSSGYVSSRENFRRPVPREVVLHKSDGDFGFTMRQIPSSMYGGKPMSGFRPTARVPALQRLNLIDPGSLADRAGLKPGDYIIEVNRECVICSPHQYVVHLITISPDALKLKVVGGAEDSIRTPYHAALPQSNNTARHVINGDTHSNSSVPRSNVPDPSYSRRSKGIPLQQLKRDAGGNQPRNTTTQAPHQTSNGLYLTVKSSPPKSKPTEPVVSNIRLSRVVDHDQVYYESGRKQKTPNASSQSRTSTSGRQRVQSFDSTVKAKSEPPRHRSQNRKAASLGSVQEEYESGSGKEAVNWSGSSVDDINHTYDKIRPVDVPFDTDEGYIRLSTNVDYVAQVEDEEDEVDFLAMAEKARQMYLRTKSAIQRQ